MPPGVDGQHGFVATRDIFRGEGFAPMDLRPSAQGRCQLCVADWLGATVAVEFAPFLVSASLYG